MQADITFAIPYFQDVGYLRVAIESVFAQTHEGWHLLVCDDSGGDAAAEELVRSYSDARVAYQRNPANLGMVANWNQCLERAPSDLVNLLHGDDALLPRYAEVMTALARRHPEASAFFCETDIIDAKGRPRFSLADSVKIFLRPRTRPGLDRVLQGEEAVRSLMAGYFIMTPTLCYRRSRLGSELFRSEWRQVQDLEFMTRLLMEGRTVVGTRETVYAYRRHAASATSLQSETRLRFDEELRAFDLIAERAEALGWHGAAKTARHKRIVKLHLLYRGLRELASLRLSASFETFRYLARASGGARNEPR